MSWSAAGSWSRTAFWRPPTSTRSPPSARGSGAPVGAHGGLAVARQRHQPRQTIPFPSTAKSAYSSPSQNFSYGRKPKECGGAKSMILISGEALIDLIPDPEKDARYDAVLGGSPYNVAIGLGRLGPKPRLSRASRPTPTARTSPPRSSKRASTCGLSRATQNPPPSPSSCAARLRPARATRSTSVRPRSTDPGHSPPNGRKAQTTCTSVRSPRCTRFTASTWSPRWQWRGEKQRRVLTPISARW